MMNEELGESRTLGMRCEIPTVVGDGILVFKSRKTLKKNKNKNMYKKYGHSQ